MSLQTCDEWQITVLNLPTAFWHQMVTQKLTLPDPVRLVILGGEKTARDRFITSVDRKVNLKRANR